jgi:putative membrane protein insertion efficiency factor
MGHRHSPEEHGGESAVHDAGTGFVAGAEEAVNSKRDNSAVEAGGLTNAPASGGGRYKSPTQKGLGVRAALFALDCYKAYLSVLFAGTCRFEPSCSRYAYEAIERFGVARGVWLGIKRLLRCHPLSRKFGYDPVPENCEVMRPNAEVTGEMREARS